MTQTIILATLGMPLAAASFVGFLALAEMRRSLKRVGGLVFWRVGRVGGSFYIARH